jgi:acetamidase/formamidase
VGEEPGDDDHLLTKDLAAAAFRADQPPVLTVQAGAGDRITFETDDLAYAQMEEFGDLAQVTATINPVTGPVFVEGAAPGDVLAVTIHAIALAEQGWSVSIPARARWPRGWVRTSSSGASPSSTAGCSSPPRSTARPPR